MKLRSPIAHKKTRLEIIPLIDVMFFLLASFMMVSLTMTKQQTIKVNLPMASATKSDFKPEMINIGVNKSGDIYLDTTPISLPDLGTKLKERHTKDPETPVYISGDSDTRHADMVKALDAVRHAGFSKVAFNVKPSDLSKPAAAPVSSPVSVPAPAPAQ